MDFANLDWRKQSHLLCYSADVFVISGISQGSLNESQLRVENEKLREALAKSSANSDKWRNQLKCLEDEKHKLLKALEESHTNLTRWENEVGAYRNRVGDVVFSV